LPWQRQTLNENGERYILKKKKKRIAGERSDAEISRNNFIKKCIKLNIQFSGKQFSKAEESKQMERVSSTINGIKARQTEFNQNKKSSVPSIRLKL